MHKEILSKKQNNLLPLIKKFDKDFYLVGGTAIALHLGHRSSIDFDLFTKKDFDNLDIRKKIVSFSPVERVIIDRKGEYTAIVDGVKTTFLFYDFAISCKDKLESIIKLPDLLTLAAMKAYALCRRAKWKDYVDLYFILSNHYTLVEINKKAKQIFGAEFNEKIFREGLCYFKDIDYSEKVDYLPGFEVKDAVIKKALVEYSLEK